LVHFSAKYLAPHRELGSSARGFGHGVHPIIVQYDGMLENGLVTLHADDFTLWGIR